MQSPKAPDPYQTAAAQQGAELGASQASSIINNANQFTPWGSRTYTQAGWETITGADGKAIKVPRYNEITRLSPDQQKLLGLSTQTQFNLGKTGVEQSAKINKLLNQNLSTQGLQAWNAGTAPGQLATTFGGQGTINRSIAGAGPIARTYGSGGAIQKQIGSGGAVRQDEAPTDRAAIEKAMMGRFNQDFAKQSAAEEAQLAARGLAPGSAGYGSVQQDQNRARTDAVQQAYLASGAESRAAQDAYNAATRQRFETGAAQGQFANQAQQQAEQQLAARAGFGNQAQQQQWGQNAAQAAFGNAAQQQAFQEALARAGFSNQAVGQRYQMGQDYAGAQNALRGAQLQERIALRNQPLNEITALMSGAQVTSPQFQSYSRQGVNAAPIGQYIGQNYAIGAQNAANFNQGLFGLGQAFMGIPGIFG